MVLEEVVFGEGITPKEFEEIKNLHTRARDLSSFSYPSGHVSRAMGSLIILSGKRSTTKTALIGGAIVVLSLSRIVLGTHYPTDIIGAISLSFAMVEVTGIMIDLVM